LEHVALSISPRLSFHRPATSTILPDSFCSELIDADNAGGTRDVFTCRVCRGSKRATQLDADAGQHKNGCRPARSGYIVLSGDFRPQRTTASTRGLNLLEKYSPAIGDATDGHE